MNAIPFVEKAVEYGFMSKEQAQRVLALKHKTGKEALEIALEQGFISHDQAILIQYLPGASPGGSVDTVNIDFSSSGTAEDIVSAKLKLRLNTGIVQRMFGRYQLQGELGRGGMGVVYKAFDPNLKRWVALKLITISNPSKARKDIDRFEREAIALGKLYHPNIVSIYEYGTETSYEGRKMPFFAMQFIEGTSLSAYIAQKVTRRKIVDVVNLFIKVGGALQYAHNVGVVHRDIKPDNVMITAEGVPKLMDFGLAKLTTNTSELTKSLEIIGTPLYMSPEQIHNPKGIDHLSDIYSLGAAFYHVLSGEKIFEGDDPVSIITNVLYCEPLPLRSLGLGIDSDLSNICAKAMDKEKSQRYSSVDEFVLDMKKYLRGEPVSASPSGLSERIIKWIYKSTRKNRNVTAMAAALVFLIVSVAGIIYYQSSVISQKDEQVKRAMEIGVGSTHDYIRAHPNCPHGMFMAEDQLEAIIKGLSSRERFVFKGSFYFKKGRYDKALGQYSQGLKFFAGDADLLCGRGYACLSLKKYSQALNDFDTAIANLEKRNRHTNWAPYYGKAIVLLRGKNDYSQALDYFRKCRELNCTWVALDDYIQICREKRQ